MKEVNKKVVDADDLKCFSSPEAVKMSSKSCGHFEQLEAEEGSSSLFINLR